MCGRYVIEGTTELSERFQLRQIPADLFPEWTTYNAAPTQLLPVIVEDDSGERAARSMQWGLVPRWRRPDGKAGVAPINARAETLFEKPMFRGLTRAKRCIVPASGFYEWSAGDKGARLPWYITRADGQPMALAGVWQRWGEVDSVAVVTTESGPGMAGVHNREPVVLEQADWPLWLGEAGHGAAVLMRASGPGVLAAPFRVGVEVNSNRAAGAGLILPVAA